LLQNQVFLTENGEFIFFFIMPHLVFPNKTSFWRQEERWDLCLGGFCG
jgi:hypothetical protein